MVACKPISAAIFGRTSLLNKGIALILERSGYDIDAEDSNLEGEAFPSDIDTESLKIIICDDGPDFSAAETINRLRSSHPSSWIVALYHADTANYVDEYFNLGADGCLPITIGPAGLISALDLIVSEKVQFIVRGWRRDTASVDKLDAYNDATSENEQKKILSASVISSRMAHSVGISGREQAVLENLIRGDSNKVIARRLSISEATVKIHVRSLLRKIGAENRTQAAIWVLNKGITGLSLASVSNNYQ